MKRHVLLLGTLFLSVLLMSCPKREERLAEGPGSAGINDSPVIGFSMDTLVVDRWRKDRNVMEKVFRERGMTLLIRDGRNSAEIQKRQVRELIDEGIDLLIIIPHDSESAADAVAEAQKRGLPVISYDRLVENAGTDAYVSFDNQEVGRLIMEGLLQRSPSGRFVLVNGAPSDYNSIMIREGVNRALEEHVGKGRPSIIDESWTDEWSSDKAYNYIYQLLQEGESFDGILTANDSLAGSAVRALAEFRLSESVAVGGQDADLDACQRIVEGTQTLTVYKPIETLVRITADLTESLLGLREPFDGDELISDGLSNIPYYKIPVIRVVRENMDEVIVESGFHPKEQIYQNVSH